MDMICTVRCVPGNRAAWDLSWEFGALGVEAALVEVRVCTYLASGSILLDHNLGRPGTVAWMLLRASHLRTFSYKWGFSKSKRI